MILTFMKLGPYHIHSTKGLWMNHPSNVPSFHTQLHRKTKNCEWNSKMSYWSTPGDRFFYVWLVWTFLLSSLKQKPRYMWSYSWAGLGKCIVPYSWVKFPSSRADFPPVLDAFPNVQKMYFCIFSLQITNFQARRFPLCPLFPGLFMNYRDERSEDKIRVWFTQCCVAT